MHRSFQFLKRSLFPPFLPSYFSFLSFGIFLHPTVNICVPYTEQSTQYFVLSTISIEQVPLILLTIQIILF